MPDEPLYTPLPSNRSFRLLQIQSLEDNNNVSEIQLQCSLEVVQLDDSCPEYVALSYTWGPPFDDPVTVEQYGENHLRTILVSHDGRPSKEQRIGRNLFEALIHVYKIKWKSFLWADALCINQSDKDERASQVQLMGNIYSKPELVAAWLGPEPATISDILWWHGPFMEYLGSVQESLTGLSLEGMMPRVSHKTDSKVLNLAQSAITVSVSRVLALRNWFRKTRYFSRTWMQQELTLPKRTYFLLCNHDLSAGAELDPDESPNDLIDILWLWMASNSEIIREFIGLEVDDKVALQIPPPPVTYHLGGARNEMTKLDQPVNTFRAQRTAWFGATGEDSDALAMLELNLARSSHLVATDPRDKIYALLGIITHITGSTIIDVDYRITIQELLRLVTLRLLNGLPYMTCLALRPPASYQRLDGLPSWAIDTTPIHRSFQPGGFSVHRKTPFNAYPVRMSEHREIKVEGNALMLYGHCCGDITWFTGGLNENISRPDFVYDPNQMLLRVAVSIRQYLKLIEGFGPKYPWIDDQPIVNALLETMTLSRDAEPLFSTKLDPAAFWIVVKRYMWRMLELSEMTESSTADAARECLEDCKVLMTSLTRSGFVPPQSVVAYLERLMEENTHLNAFETDATFDAEKPLALPLLQNPLTADRVVFRTEHGFLGLGADDMRLGDQVWVLRRARVPQILRPMPDGTLITLGEACVHGGVDGELFDKCIAGPLRKITIV